MVRIVKLKKQNSEFYYLVHNIRLNNKVLKKEKYLGKTIPKNIDQLKNDFERELFFKQYEESIKQIKKDFEREQKLTPKSAKEKNLNNFLTKFTYNTNKIEGSTLTLKETSNILDEKITPKNKPIKDIKETEGHKKAFDDMYNYEGELNLTKILFWHKLIFQNSDDEIAGKIRKHKVGISGSKVKLALPIEIDLLLKEFFDWYKKQKSKLNEVELAALVHLKFVFIHPFSDGNGRLSRLLMNFILKKNGFPMISINYEDRHSYYRALERSQLNKKEKYFVRYLIKNYIKKFRK